MRIRIWDPASLGPWIQDPGWKNSDPRDKHPGSATLINKNQKKEKKLTITVNIGTRNMVKDQGSTVVEYEAPIIFGGLVDP